MFFLFQKTTVAPSIKHISALANFIIIFMIIAICGTTLQARAKKHKHCTRTSKVIYKKKHKPIKSKTHKEIKAKTTKDKTSTPQPAQQACIKDSDKDAQENFLSTQNGKIKSGTVAPPKYSDYIGGPSYGIDVEYKLWKKLVEEPTPIVQELKQFIAQHKDWPNIRLLKEKLENQLTFQNGVDELLKWFEDNNPITIKGTVLYAKVLIKNGKNQDASYLIKKAWRTSNAPQSEVDVLRTEFKDVLDSKDYQLRINLL
jgi:hypothetical protein